MRLPDGKVVAWAHKHTPQQKLGDDIKDIVLGDMGSCNTCMSRARRLVLFSGKDGQMFQGCPDKKEALDEQDRLDIKNMNSLAKIGREHLHQPHQMVLVTQDTFQPPSYTGPGSRQGETFYHISINPAEVTSPELVRRMEALWPKIKSSVSERLSKFFFRDARDTMQLIRRLLTDPSLNLKRPQHWRRTFDWITALQAKFGTEWEDMTPVERETVCIYAMATGAAEADVHKDFQTLSNFVDFMTMESLEAIGAEMDRRSDPATFQVSQVARARAAKNIEDAPFFIALAWDGKEFRDDLDIHVKTPFGEIYYGRLEVYSGANIMGRLDFDAGVSGKEDEPVENVSFSPEMEGKTVEIWVHMFSRRTTNKPCKFSIVITENGESEVMEFAMPVHQDKLTIKTHRFGTVKKHEVQLSEPQARAMRAQEAEFEKLFGKPTSTIASLDHLAESHSAEVHFVSGSVARQATGKTTVTGALAAGVEAGLSVLASLSRPKPRAAGASNDGEGPRTRATGKKMLSQREAERHASGPRTVADLVEKLKAGSVNKLEIHLPDHSPGYVTRVTTEGPALKTTDGAGEYMTTTEGLSLCHYQDKFKPPLGVATEPGTARLDPAWHGCCRSYGSDSLRVYVAFVATINGKVFLGIEGGVLPEDRSAFPRAAGFWPQMLSTEAHKHRSKWSFLNSSAEPDMCKGIPAIGTFLTGDTTTVFVDGKKMVLKT